MVVCSKSDSASLSICDFTCVCLVIASEVPCYDASHGTILRSEEILLHADLGNQEGKGGKNDRSVKYTAYIFQQTALLMLSCVVPPAHMRMFEAPSEDLGL